MITATYISHYFEYDSGPLLNICDLDTESIHRLIEREREAETGFNRFSQGKAFFDFRMLADDLLMELYTNKFGRRPACRPFYAVLGDADVVGGLYRDPHKIRIPLDALKTDELTFMTPDHFHLVGLSKTKVKKHFGIKLPQDYDESKYPYYGKLLTLEELIRGYHDLGIEKYLEERRKRNDWYRYIEAHIWKKPDALRAQFTQWVEVDPDSWTQGNITHLQNYKHIRKQNTR